MQFTKARWALGVLSLAANAARVNPVTRLAAGPMTALASRNGFAGR